VRRLLADAGIRVEADLREQRTPAIRCFPLDQPEGPGTCLMTGQKAERIAIFAKAY